MVIDPSRFPDPNANVHPSYDTTTGKSKIRRKSDGLVFDVWAIDAKDRVGLGAFEYVPRDTPTVRQRLEALSYAELVALSQQDMQRNIMGNASAGDLVNLLCPLFEAGTVVFPETV